MKKFLIMLIKLPIRLPICLLLITPLLPLWLVIGGLCFIGETIVMIGEWLVSISEFIETHTSKFWKSYLNFLYKTNKYIP